MVTYCAVYGCASSSKDKQRLLYPFPLDQRRCSVWLHAIHRPDLAHLTIHDLHNDFRVCDIHFIFLDEHKILLDDAIPNLNLPFMNLMDDLSKCTQTNYSCNTIGTQTDLVTTEMACQTEQFEIETPQWKIDNPLKRKLLITLAFDSDAPNADQSTALAVDAAPNPDESLTNQPVSSVTCEPDISLASKLEKEKTVEKNEGSKKRKSKGSKIKIKIESKKSKRNKAGTRIKKEKTKKKVISESEGEDSADGDDVMDYDTLMASRLEEAIKLIQQQWKIHEKKYRKGQSGSEVENVDDPVEKLRVKQGRAYGNELKFLALNLFYSNPTAYKALRQHLNLPTEKTLRRIEVGLSTKLTPTVMNCLRLIVSKLKQEEKICVICVNMLPLKEEIHKIANSDKSIGYHEINESQGPEAACKTLVVLINGLYSDWKQPLITCYLKENFDVTEVNEWLEQIVTSLTEIGLKVVGLTTNEHPDIMNMAKQRNISTDRPFFFINNLKMYYIFDIFHIMNSLRNLLLNNYFRFIDVDGSEQIVSWFDVEKLYETDKTRCYKLAPKLTESHIRPSELDKTRFQYSTQVFSKTVAAGIINCIELKHLTSRSFGTVKFVELMNNVFDILNSLDEKELCRFKIPFCFKDYQLDVLEKILNILPSLKIITKNYEDITSTVETLKCLEVTIRSALSLAADMKNVGYQYLCTRNLSLQHLDEFFESLRRKWGFKPSPVLFYAGWRNFFLENVIKKSESNDSCGLDKDLISILLNNSADNEKRKEKKEVRTEVNKEGDFNPFFKYL